ncbi:MAG: hypothetical protein WC364_12750 [Eubacteriales bacterium]
MPTILKMRLKIITVLLAVLFLFALPLPAQADTPKIKVIYNGVDMTDSLQPFIKNNVTYTINKATVNMITSGHKMETFPIF